MSIWNSAPVMPLALSEANYITASEISSSDATGW